jgi:hypothetical protein
MHLKGYYFLNFLSFSFIFRKTKKAKQITKIPRKIYADGIPKSTAEFQPRPSPGPKLTALIKNRWLRY